MLQKPVGIILAGGLARRMGGASGGANKALDKGLLELGGQTMLGRVMARLQPQVHSLALSANGDPQRFSEFSLEVLGDSIKGYAGPLAGILSGLDWGAKQGATHVVSVAVDTPFFPENLVSALQETGQRCSKPIVLAASSDDEKGMMRHPTFGLWPVVLREDLRLALSGGVRKVLQWAEEKGCCSAEFETLAYDPFFNINTTDDLLLAKQIIRAEKQ